MHRQYPPKTENFRPNCFPIRLKISSVAVETQRKYVLNDCRLMQLFHREVYFPVYKVEKCRRYACDHGAKQEIAAS